MNLTQRRNPARSRLLYLGFLPASIASADLKIDFGSGNLTADHQAYAAVNAAPDPLPVTYSAVSTGLNSDVTVDVDAILDGNVLTANVPANVFRVINRTVVPVRPTANPDLFNDWLAVAQLPGQPETVLRISVSGLPDGNYRWTSWHHDITDQTGNIDVAFKVGGVAINTQTAIDVSQGNNVIPNVNAAVYAGTHAGSAPNAATDTPVPYVQSFTVTGGAKVEFELSPQAPANTAALNPTQFLAVNFTVTNGFSIQSLSADPEDTDADGMKDAWEMLHFQSLAAQPTEDTSDSDGVSNIAEFLRGSSPLMADTDMDGLNDAAENNTRVFQGPTSAGSNPTDTDTDDDGVLDSAEVADGRMNPNLDDTDSDGLKDAVEVAGNTQPNRADSDGDALADGAEVAAGSDPKDVKSPRQRALVAYWPLDTTDGITTPDVGPSAYHMSLNSMTAANFVDDEGRRAAVFYGAEMLTRTHAAGEELPISLQPAFTISLWVKVLGTGQSDRRYFSEGSNSNDNPLLNLGTHNTGVDNRTSYFARNVAAPGHQYSVGTPLDGTWHHIALTHNILNQRNELYIDGVLDRGDYVFQNYAGTPMNITSIGGILRALPSHWVSGMVDNVSVWRASLSAAAITDLVSGVDPLLSLPPEVNVPVKLVTRDPATDLVTLTWNSNPGKIYKILATNDLTQPKSTWVVLSTNTMSGGALTQYTDPQPAGSLGRRFYFVKEN